MRQPTYNAAEREQLKRDARKYIIGHWMSNADLDKRVNIFTAGSGCDIYDIDGNKYLDTFSSLITTACGHGRDEIKQAIADQMDQLAFFPNYHDGFTVPQIQLAKKLAEITPPGLEVTFYLNSGSEANETAVKMARQYFWTRGEKSRFKVISRRGSYHGTTLAATSWTGFSALREPMEPLMPGSIFAPQVKCARCELGLKPETCRLACLKALRTIVEAEGPNTVAAVIMDPIPGSNSGYPLPPDGYLRGVRDLCDEYGVMLIFDEIQTGFGKTGKWFACEHWGVTPDILTMSKAITSGYLPLGALITTRKIADVFNEKPGNEFRSGSTFGGHTLSCVAALANIAIFEREKLVERAAETGIYLRRRFEALRHHRIVGDIQGLGTLWAIELVADRQSRRELTVNMGSFVRDRCQERGMILRNNRNTLVVAPALVISREEIDRCVDLLDGAIADGMRRFEV